MSSTLPSRASNRLSTWFNRDPFASFRDEVNDLIGRLAVEFDTGDAMEARMPSMDLSETDKQIEVKMDVPGMKADEINVEVQGNTLVISGEHREEKEEKGKTFHRMERRCGSIRRMVTLPCAVDEGNISAECNNGVLTVTLPKAETAQKRKIPVKG